MKKRPSPNKGNPSAQDKREFTGTDNPRHLRVLLALIKGPSSREAVDCIAGCSNGPALVNELRNRGLELPCQRAKGKDRDGRPVRFGVYHLTSQDKPLVLAWLRRRQRSLKQGGQDETR